MKKILAAVIAVTALTLIGSAVYADRYKGSESRIASSGSAVLLKKDDDSLWGWGYIGYKGENGDLLSPEKLFDDVKSFDVCDKNNFRDSVMNTFGVLKNDGSLYTWEGENAPVKIADGCINFKMSADGFLYLKSNGDLYGVGNASLWGIGGAVYSSPMLVASGVSEHNDTWFADDSKAAVYNEVYTEGVKTRALFAGITPSGDVFTEYVPDYYYTLDFNNHGQLGTGDAVAVFGANHVASTAVSGISVGGAVLGETTYSDIVTYINNFAIPSFNYRGYTFICAEDLQNYGFDVECDRVRNTVTLNLNHNKIIQYPVPVVRCAPGDIGKHYFNVTTTPTKAYIGNFGYQIEALGGIEGYTLINIHNLLACGAEISWDAENRAVHIDFAQLNSSEVPWGIFQ